ncbi:MAG: hypothetical protein KDD83_29000, partial [Caldilineaceae bacterium]|nr:hypothetical protein [Caldilineaceae bacterium]
VYCVTACPLRVVPNGVDSTFMVLPFEDGRGCVSGCSLHPVWMEKSGTAKRPFHSKWNQNDGQARA